MVPRLDEIEINFFWRMEIFKDMRKCVCSGDVKQINVSFKFLSLRKWAKRVLKEAWLLIVDFNDHKKMKQNWKTLFIKILN